MERLQKVMAKAGVASRRQSEKLILQGVVTVNGQVIQELGAKIDPALDVIKVAGRKVELEQKKTFLFYKPLSVISSMSDPQNRKVVADFFEEVPERVYPVGRLDYDTEGLLLMTNDGELANRLTHPRYKVKKSYRVRVKGIPTKETLQQLQAGIHLDDGLTAPAEVKLLRAESDKAQLLITIHEGRNRQVRRMFEAVGHQVSQLRRVKVGFLNLDGLQRCKYRECTEQELSKLYRMLGM